MEEGDFSGDIGICSLGRHKMTVRLLILVEFGP